MEIPVQDCIDTIGGFFTHAGQSGLFGWIGAVEKPKKIFLVHGEDHPQAIFAAKLKERSPESEILRSGYGERFAL